MSTGAQLDSSEQRTERNSRSPAAGSASASSADGAANARSTAGAPGAPSAQAPVRTGGTGASLEDLAAHLAALPDADVVELLVARPDLTTPPSASFTALAARAGARPSVEAALAHLDTPTLAVAEAVVALGMQDTDALAEALGLDSQETAAHLDELARLALVIDTGAVVGLVDVFGPHPFGLGPEAADPPVLPPPLSELRAAPGELSEGALGMLQALAWGPPVGTLRSGGKAPVAAELVQRGWLIRDHDTAGRTRFVMPRQVALALRGGLLPREPLEAPDCADLEALSVDAVAAEATRHAEEAVRLVAALLAEWGRDGGGILRTGGVGVRALSRTAEALDVEPGTAATIIEAAAAAGAEYLLIEQDLTYGRDPFDCLADSRAYLRSIGY